MALSMNSNSNMQRTVIVNLIHQKRRVLFGRKADAPTRVRIRVGMFPASNLLKRLILQTSAWGDIADEAKKLGMYPEERDFAYLRDVRWQNWRKRTIVCEFLFHEYRQNSDRAIAIPFEFSMFSRESIKSRKPKEEKWHSLTEPINKYLK